MKEKLAAKIDNAEAFEVLWAESASQKRRHATDFLSRFIGHEAPWWARREQFRIAYEFYECSDVLNALNEKFPVFAHVSKEDKNLVAYTPDATMGAADRQIKCSIGKLLSRYYVLYSEDWIREQVESHVAEVNIKVDWYDGTEIAVMYEKFGSVGACMSGKWKDVSKHPALAYNTPGVKLAVVWNAEKTKILARCLTVETAERKSFIRGYGHPSLIKWLQAEGYTPGGWQGIKFNPVVKETHPSYKVYAFPYLDSMGGMATTANSRIVSIDGELMCPTDEQWRALKAAGLEDKASSAGSGGSLTIADIESVKYSFTDAFTGEQVSLLTNTEEVVKVYPEGAKALKRNMPISHVFLNGMYVPEDKLIKIGWSWFINDAAEIHKAGLRKLSAKHYPELADKWYTRYEVVDVADGTSIKAEDGVVVVTAQNERSVIHKTELDKTWIALYGKHTHNGVTGTVYAHKDADWFRTPSKLKVHKAVHDLCTMWDGTVDFERGKISTTFMGEPYWMKPSDKEKFFASRIHSDRLDRLAGTSATPLRMLGIVSDIHSGAYTSHARIKALTGASFGGIQVGGILRRLAGDLSMADFKLIISECYGDVALNEPYSSVEDRARVTIISAWLNRRIAEMEAAEAPHYLYPAAEVVLPVAEAATVEMPEPHIEILPAAETVQVLEITAEAVN